MELFLVYLVFIHKILQKDITDNQLIIITSELFFIKADWMRKQY